MPVSHVLWFIGCIPFVPVFLCFLLHITRAVRGNQVAQRRSNRPSPVANPEPMRAARSAIVVANVVAVETVSPQDHNPHTSIRLTGSSTQ